jgi:prepilin-type N-terminal cleavage/methylation domain-containing protein
VRERRRATGFTLVETLVAMLLVAIALLGVTGLQLVSLQAGARALELLAATSLASSHAERIRALHDAPDEARARLAEPGDAIGCGPARACTPLEFAADEAARWTDDDGRAWRVQPPAVELAAAPAQVSLGIQRSGQRLIELDVET